MPGLNIFAKVGLDGRGFQHGIKQLERSSEGFGRRFAAIVGGYFTISYISQATRRTVEWATSIGNLSRQAGISAEALQELEYAGSQTGVTLQEISDAFKDLSKNRTDALKGSKDKLALFDILGIDPATLERSSLEEIFMRIAESFRTTDFGAAGQGILDQLLGGTAGPKLLVTFKAGLQDLRAEARRLKAVTDEETVKQLEEAAKGWHRLTMIIRSTFAEAIAFVIQQLEAMIIKLKEAALLSANIIQVTAERAKAGKEKAEEIADEAQRRGIFSSPIVTDEEGGSKLDKNFFKRFKLFKKRGHIIDKAMKGSGKSILEEAENRTAEQLAEDLANAGSKTPPPAPGTVPDFGKLFGQALAAKALAGAGRSDSLARIGGFVGPGAGAANVAREQLRHLKSIEENTGKTTRVLERGA